MKCAALTGISPEIIKDLRGGKPRTIELQSMHNIVSIAGVKPDPESHIFMTSIDLEDLDPGDQGICVIVLAVSVSMKRMVEFSHGSVLRGKRADVCPHTGEILCIICRQAGLSRWGVWANNC